MYVLDEEGGPRVDHLLFSHLCIGAERERTSCLVSCTLMYAIKAEEMGCATNTEHSAKHTSPPCAVSVESIGAIPPDVIFEQAINVLEDKCTTLLKCLEDLSSDRA